MEVNKRAVGKQDRNVSHFSISVSIPCHKEKAFLSMFIDGDRSYEPCKVRKPGTAQGGPETTVSFNLRVCGVLITRLEAISLRSFL